MFSPGKMPRKAVPGGCAHLGPGLGLSVRRNPLSRPGCRAGAARVWEPGAGLGEGPSPLDLGHQAGGHRPAPRAAGGSTKDSGLEGSASEELSSLPAGACATGPLTLRGAGLCGAEGSLDLYHRKCLRPWACACSTLSLLAVFPLSRDQVGHSRAQEACNVPGRVTRLSRPRCVSWGFVCENNTHARRVCPSSHKGDMQECALRKELSENKLFTRNGCTFSGSCKIVGRFPT